MNIATTAKLSAVLPSTLAFSHNFWSKIVLSSVAFWSCCLIGFFGAASGGEDSSGSSDDEEILPLLYQLVHEGTRKLFFDHHLMAPSSYL